MTPPRPPTSSPPPSTTLNNPHQASRLLPSRSRTLFLPTSADAGCVWEVRFSGRLPFYCFAACLKTRQILVLLLERMVGRRTEIYSVYSTLHGIRKTHCSGFRFRVNSILAFARYYLKQTVWSMWCQFVTMISSSCVLWSLSPSHGHRFQRMLRGRP